MRNALLIGACLAAAMTSAKADNAQYFKVNAAEEIALARSAAPPSISKDADVLVLSPHGYEIAVKGTNGVACLVLRSWTAGLEDPVFWNAKIRGPACLNPPAARSVLPHIVERSQWVLAGVSKAEMTERIKAQLAANSFALPEPGAMTFMMSKQQYLSDEGTHHWHPHLMFYLANMPDAALGANLPGSPVFAGREDPGPVTIFMVPVETWSDGTKMEMK